MKAIKYTNYILIEGLEEHSQAYDNKSFIIKRLDSSSVLFLLEIVSPFSVKLNFNEEVNDDILIVSININCKNYNILTEKEIEIPDKPTNPDKPINQEINYDFDDKYFIINNDEDIYINDISINMIKYTLERYDDFPDEKIKLDIPYDYETGLINKEIPFEIEYDRIYRITIRYKDNSTTKDYIYDKPTHYYSSIYHLKQLANNFDLYINNSNKNDFDLKLLIWKYSNIAAGIAGIIDDVVYDNNNSILNDYVGQRALLDIISQAIKESNITPDTAKNSLGSISVTLADLSHGASTVETITTQLLKVHKELYNRLRNLEKDLKEYFSYLQTEEKLDNKLFKSPDIKRVNTFNPYLPRRRKYRR